jgi:formate hydrogenlyase subunit 3/multisubunit Na+/H+ antiporter MnhD subunit
MDPTSGQLLIAWLVVGPLASAAVAFLLGRRGAGPLVVTTLGTLLAAALMLAERVMTVGPQRIAVGGWGAPLGIELRADGLSAVMVLVTATVGVPVGLYAERFFAGHPRQSHFWPLAWLLWASMNAVYLSDDGFNIYVALELLGLAAVGLVALEGEAAALAAALRYLLAALLGSLAYLMGVSLLYGAYGTLALGPLASRVTAGVTTWVPFALMASGLMLKTALFPLHFWLPSAHGTAPTPVSALLSALVIKASFYLLLRLWFELFANAVSVSLAQALGALGAAAIVWGSMLALRQRRLKMLVAYSTVAQIGYLFLIFPLATRTPTEAAVIGWVGGIYHLLAHALAKGGMFLAVGAMAMAVGSGDIRDLERLGARLPVSLFAFGLAGLSLMGLPPSGGFVAKWLLLESALATGQWWWVAVMIAGGLLTAAYVFRVLRCAFLPPGPGPDPARLPLSLELTAFTLALGSLLLGMYAPTPMVLMRIGAPFDFSGR